MKRASLLLVLPLFALLLGVLAAAMPQTSASAVDDEALADRRARWHAMPIEQRLELRARFEKLRDLPPERRAELRERAHDLRQREDRLRQRDEFRREFESRTGTPLESADPERVRAAMRDYRRRCDRERGEGLRERLPEDLRRQLEAAAPEQRPALLRDFLRERRAEHQDRFLGGLARRLRLEPAELARLRSLEGAERHGAIRELHRRVIEQEVEELGLGDVEPEEWRQVRALDTERFLERVRWLDLPRRPWRGGFGRRPDGDAGPSGRPPGDPRRPGPPAKPLHPRRTDDDVKPPPARRSARPRGPSG